MRLIQQWPYSAAGCFASGCECRLRDNPCCPLQPGVKQMGRGTMAGPIRRAAVTDTATEDPKNAWSRARAMDLTATTTTTSAAAPPRSPHLTPLMSHGALGHLQRRPPTRQKNHTEPAAAAETSVGTVDFLGKRTNIADRGQPHPISATTTRHGYSEHLRAEHLRAWEEKEESRSHGSD